MFAKSVINSRNGGGLDTKTSEIPKRAVTFQSDKSRTQSANKSEEISGEYGLKKYTMQDFVPFNMPIHIFNAVFVLIPAHIFGLWGFWLSFSGQTTNAWACFLFFIIYGYGGGLGVTAGAHRLWTHRCYQAKTPLKIMLMLMQTTVIQHCLIKWCRDHRIHHKYTDTNADPHSAARGFWFAHMGWVYTPEHPEVLKKEKTIPMDDFENDPILQWQAKYYWPMVVLTAFVIPMTFIHFVFPQPFFNIICINYSRWLLTTHLSGLINSAAHYFGDRPYQKSISAVDNKIMAFFTVGEAWHNYHHTFPWDYKTSELPIYTFNWTTGFIDLMAKLGLAYDLKTVPAEMVESRAQRTGDGTHPSVKNLHHHSHSHDKNQIEVVDETENSDEILPTKIDGKLAAWGWGDEDMAEEASLVNQILHRRRER